MKLKKVKIGQRRIEQDLAPVLTKAWKTGFTCQSNFAREQANLVGMAASMGLITTRIIEGVYSRDWHMTAKGIRVLMEMELLDD